MQPPEKGGIGMSRVDALACTMDEAVFYLSSDDRVKKACKQMNLRAAGVEHGNEVQAWRDEMKARRRFYTGSDELKG